MEKFDKRMIENLIFLVSYVGGYVTVHVRQKKEEELVRAQVYIGERVRGFLVVAGATRVQRTF